MVKYIKVYHDLISVVDELSDAEAGRLFKALLAYGNAEEVRALSGQEKLVFAMVRAQIDRDRESYDKKSQQNRENGAKGGRPRKPTGLFENPTKPTGLFENPTKPTGLFENPEKAKKSQDKDKDKDNIIPLPPSQVDEDDDEDFFRIQQDHNRIFDAAGRAGFPPTDAIRDKFIDIYGEQACLYGKHRAADRIIAAIDICAEHSAVNLAYLRAVLQDKPKPEEEAPGDWMESLRRRGIGG